MFAKPADSDAFDPLAPENVSPLVAYLASEDCPINGKMFAVQGGQIAEVRGWTVLEGITSDEPWTVDSVISGLGAAAAV
jgi:hypothetical protein